jgi:hypothetical protein
MTDTPIPTVTHPVATEFPEGNITTSSDYFVPDPQPGSIGFWERIAKSGAATLASIGILVVWIVMIFTGIVYPADFRYAYGAALAFLFGKGLLTAFTSK